MKQPLDAEMKKHPSIKDAENASDLHDGLDEDELDRAMVDALGAGNTSAFFKKLFRGIKKVARKAAPIAGKTHSPTGQGMAIAARLARRFQFGGANEGEALEAFVEAAARDRRALPIVAGVAARTLLESEGMRMSPAMRNTVVKDVKNAARILVAKRGRKAIRALPKIIKGVKRTASGRRAWPIAGAREVRRGAAKVAASPTLSMKLADTNPH